MTEKRDQHDERGFFFFWWVRIKDVSSTLGKTLEARHITKIRATKEGDLVKEIPALNWTTTMT